MADNFEATGQIRIKVPKGAAVSEPVAESAPAAPHVAVLRAKAVKLQEFIDRNLADMMLQLNCYRNFCTRITAGGWTLDEAADYLLLLVKSLGFDGVGLLLLDPDRPGTFLPPVCRGDRCFPVAAATDYWRTAWSADRRSLDWDAWLELARGDEAPFAAWLEEATVIRLGFSPVQDGERIVGAIIIVSYTEKELSPPATILLELSGGHLGLALAAGAAATRGGDGFVATSDRNTKS